MRFTRRVFLLELPDTDVIPTPLRIALRADASARIGLGHVKRTIALALALRSLGAQVRLITRDLGVDVGTLVEPAGLEISLLPRPTRKYDLSDHVPHAPWAGVGWQEDADACVDKLAHWHPDWVVVDHYAFDARWHRQVAAALGSRIGVIDDLADRDLQAQLLIDQNLSSDHRRKYLGRLPARSRLLGGPRFALLDPKYAALPAFGVHREVRSIGIFMGGVDATNLSSAALRACREHARFEGVIEVVATRANPHLTALQALAEQWPNTIIQRDLPNLVDFFWRHDMQLGAGGGAAWERCCVGAPTLALIAADNQHVVLPHLAELGAVALLAPELSCDEAAIGREVTALMVDHERREVLSNRSRELVDGIGAKRVALCLLQGALQLRAAGPADADLLFDWRNHPASRAVSRNSNPIDRPDHEQWLAHTLGDVNRSLLIAHVGPVDVGVIRFDLRERAAEVSLYLDPALHGLGLGPTLLRAGETRVLASNWPVDEFVAEVLPGNMSSQRLFEQGGYRFEGSVGRKCIVQQLTGDP